MHQLIFYLHGPLNNLGLICKGSFLICGFHSIGACSSEKNISRLKMEILSARSSPLVIKLVISSVTSFNSYY
jgi:hypothetical protein